MASLVRRLAINERGRDFFVGDIHGCFDSLEAKLAAIGFSPDAGDRLISVGDLVDRGPQSDLALEWLGYPWFYAVRGNHEEMAIDWAADCADEEVYIENGGEWNVRNSLSMNRRIADAFLALPVAMEVETTEGVLGIVHAGCPYRHWGTFRGVLESGSDVEVSHACLVAMWTRNRIEGADRSLTAGVLGVVVGHAVVDAVTVLGNTIYIDTGGWSLEGNGFTVMEAKEVVEHLQRSTNAAAPG